MTARHFWAVLPILSLAVGLVAQPAWAQTYQLIDLAARGVTAAYGINDAGQVAGVGASGALIYSNGVVTSVGTLPGGGQSIAQAISATGAVTGFADTGGTDSKGNPITHAFLYADGLMTDLGTLPGVGGSSDGYGINTSGEVTGADFAPPNASGTQVPHAFLYSGGLMADIGTFPGGTGAYGQAINASGQIAGLAYASDGNAHAFRYSSGVIKDLGTLGGTTSGAVAINDSGLTTGVAATAHDTADAFISDGVTMTDLGNLGGAPAVGNIVSYGWGINASGAVTGYSSVPGTDQAGNSIVHAFLFSNGVMVDLNSLVEPNDPLQPYVTLTQGSGINDAGSIIATGTDSREPGVERVYLLVAAGTPIPPSFSASGTTVAVGTPVTLTWSGPAGTTCTATGGGAGDGWTGSLPLSGSKSVTESAVGQYTYAVACTGSNGTAQAQLTVTVVLPTVTLSANTSSVFIGVPVLLIWGASSGTSCTATGGNSGDGWTGNLAVSGSKSVTESAAGQYSYGITCTSGGHAAQAQVTVSVAAPAVTLTASAATVLVGTPVTLTWNATAGSVCTATNGSSGDGWTGSLATSGSKPITESTVGKTTYGISCTGGNQTAQAQVTVTIALPSVSLSATPSTVTMGQVVVLTWSSTGASACTASGGGSGDGWAGTKGTSGTASITETAAATYTYTLVCSAGGQLVQAQAVVTVNSPPSSGGGGALDGWSLLALSTIFGLRRVVRQRAIQLRR